MEAPARTDATAPVPEEQLAALREEIRRAGRSARWLSDHLWLRLTVGVLVTPGAAALLLLKPLRGQPADAFWFGVVIAVIAALALLLPAVVIGIGCAELCYGVSLWKGARRLRHDLSTLPPAERRRVLLPLREEGGEASVLAGRLLCDLNLPTELTPAGTPQGSGAEVSGADRAT